MPRAPQHFSKISKSRTLFQGPAFAVQGGRPNLRMPPLAAGHFTEN